MISNSTDRHLDLANQVFNMGDTSSIGMLCHLHSVSVAAKKDRQTLVVAEQKEYLTARQQIRNQ
jgi:hypothetical protein